jgi:L-asparaginase
MSDTPVPLVALFGLGGTIATVPGPNGMLPALTADDLARALGDIRAVARLNVESVRQLPSSDLRFSDIAEVGERVRRAIAEGAHGVVITQGTDTLEETAFLLDLLLDVERPVVVTGAMRSPDLPGADGAANLLGTIRVAAATHTAGLGVLVVMNDEIHAARFVKKLHTSKPSAFGSPNAGPLGWIAEDRVRIALRPVEPVPTLAWRAEPPAVPLITMGFSFDPASITSLVRDPPAGVVIAALGVGHVPSWTIEPLKALASKVPVVLASRAGSGELFREMYDFAGSEVDLLNQGCVSAGSLDAAKARILLSLLLADGADRRRIAETFAHF